MKEGPGDIPGAKESAVNSNSIQLLRRCTANQNPGSGNRKKDEGPLSCRGGHELSVNPGTLREGVPPGLTAGSYVAHRRHPPDDVPATSRVTYTSGRVAPLESPRQHVQRVASKGRGDGLFRTHAFQAILLLSGRSRKQPPRTFYRSWWGAALKSPSAFRALCGA